MRPARYYGKLKIDFQTILGILLLLLLLFTSLPLPPRGHHAPRTASTLPSPSASLHPSPLEQGPSCGQCVGTDCPGQEDPASPTLPLSSSSSSSSFTSFFLRRRRKKGPILRHYSRYNCPRPDILFQCPDGRIGLHIIHTRFLISQSESNLIFQASRLSLLHTFLIPSLRNQTSKNFVVYASYDPLLRDSVIKALETALALTGAHVIMSPEHGTSMERNFTNIVHLLTPVDFRVEDADMYITSRLDIDDTVHVQSVAAVQKFACSGTGADAPVRVAYIQQGQLWFPSLSPLHPYGQVGIWKTWKERVYDDIYKFLAIMQSMILSGQDFIKTCEGLTVYSYPHYRPENLTHVTLAQGGIRCPPFEFKPDVKKSNKFMLMWSPPEGEVGNLYVRTMSSWTHEKIDLHYRLEPANASVLQRSFGVAPAELAAINLMFSGFEDNGTLLLLNNSIIPIE